MAERQIRILIVDDHFIARAGLTASINAEADMRVIAEAVNGGQAIDAYRQHRPDVVLMDLRLPEMDGIEATAAIRAEFPQARVIAISTYYGDEDVYRALQAGARGYLVKDVRREELLEAVRAVHRGQRRLPPQVAEQLAERLPHSELSPRETEVLKLIVGGLSNREIAGELHISEITVKIHVTNILGKLGVRDRTQAVSAALRRGIVHID